MTYETKNSTFHVIDAPGLGGWGLHLFTLSVRGSLMSRAWRPLERTILRYSLSSLRGFKIGVTSEVTAAALPAPMAAAAAASV